MFSLRIGKPTAPWDWRLFGRRFTCQDGWIEPLYHPMVAVEAVLALDGRAGFAVLERPAGRRAGDISLTSAANPRDFARAKAVAANWPLHWFWVEFNMGDLTIEASDLPTVPVYLAGSRLEAHADWDPLNLYGVVDGQLDRAAAAHFLATFEQPYGPRTIIGGMKRLCAGYRAEWIADAGWRLAQPPGEQPSHPRSLALGADPVDTFTDMLDAAVARVAPGPGTPLAAELSGGLDSTLVASVAASGGRPVSTYGLIMPGEAGARQRARRQASVDEFRLRDVALPAAEHRIWSSPAGRVAQNRVVPWEELYHDLFDELYRRAAGDRQSILLSGLGGDDLLMPYWDEKPDPTAELDRLLGRRNLPPFVDPRLAPGLEASAAAMHATPLAFAQRAVMAAAANSATQSLRHGLWPVHPLITPEIVHYCHALPREWREGRRLMREALARLGLPPSVTHPAGTEDFNALCEQQMRTCPVFRELLLAGSLADLELVDPGAVAIAFDQWRTGHAPNDWDLSFIAIVILEATLRSLRDAAIGPTRDARIAYWNDGRTGGGDAPLWPDGGGPRAH